MNRELYEARMLEILMDEQNEDRKINDDLVEVQTEIVRNILNGYTKPVNDEWLRLQDRTNDYVLQEVYKQVKELYRYTQEPGISQSILDDANVILTKAKEVLGETCTEGETTEDKNYKKLSLAIKTIESIIHVIQEYIDSNVPLNTESLDSQYGLIKPKLEKVYEIRKSILGEKGTKADEDIKSVIIKIKDIKDKINKVKTHEKPVDKAKIQEFDSTLKLVKKLGHTKIDAKNIEKIQKSTIESTTKLKSLLGYVKTLGETRKDSLYARDYNFGGISTADEIVWLTPSQYNFAVDVGHLLKYTINLENSLNRKITELQVGEAKDYISTEQFEINCLTLFDPIALIGATHSAKIKKTSNLVDINKLGISDYYTDSIKEDMNKNKQQKITFGVFCRTYMLKYMKNAHKYNMDSKSPILQNYLNTLYTRLEIENK